MTLDELQAQVNALEDVVNGLSTKSAQSPTPAPSPSSSTVSTTSGFAFHSVAEQVLASYDPAVHPGSYIAVPWTKLDMSQYVPRSASWVLLWVYAEDQGNPAGLQAIQMRPTAQGNVYSCVSGTIRTNDSDLHYSAQFWFPCGPGATIWYQVVNGFEDGWSINLQGWM